MNNAFSRSSVMIAVLMAVSALLPVSKAEAQPAIDISCFAWLYQPNGKVKKASVPRRSQARLGKSLYIDFRAKYYSGEVPVETLVAIVEYPSRNVLKIFDDTVNPPPSPRWSPTYIHETPYGRVRIKCEGY